MLEECVAESHSAVGPAVFVLRPATAAPPDVIIIIERDLEGMRQPVESRLPESEACPTLAPGQLRPLWFCKRGHFVKDAKQAQRASHPQDLSLSELLSGSLVHLALRGEMLIVNRAS